MKRTTTQIKEALEGLTQIWITDYKLAKELKARHLRGGKITKADSKEGAGVEVLGFGFDELFNIVAICKDGGVRQYLGLEEQ